jgi:ketosteroid isomerase-like protein
VAGENLELVGILREAVPDDWVETLADEERLDAIRHQLAQRVGDDFEVTMMGGIEITGTGFAGVIEAFRDWISAYDHYRVEWEEVLDAGDRVVVLVRQAGIISESGVEVDARSAVVFAFEDGRLARMEFHLEREPAYRSAGLPFGA